MNYIANAVRSKGDPQIIQSGQSSLTSADRLCTSLGWFSIALGITELLAARGLAHTLGLEGREGLIRAFGVRELGAGIATLSTEKRVGLWSRVVGDALDLATLATAAAESGPRQRSNALLAMLGVGAIGALDVLCAIAVTKEQSRQTVARNYGDRSGFPKGLAAAKGTATDFKVPTDMRAAIGP